MNIIIALIPALLWGIMPLIITKVGGTARQQTMGVTLGAFGFALIVFAFRKPDFTVETLVVSFITGCLWSVGQMFQLQSFKIIGVSKAMPISTGMQLVGTTLCGVLLFHEWDTLIRLILGFSALILIIGGIFLTSYAEQQVDGEKTLSRGLVLLTISSLGYISYVVVIQGFHINGFDAILPQAVGMVLSAYLLTFNGKEKRFTKRTWLIMIPGMIWAGGNLAMLYANGLVGVATGFSLSQLGVVISTLGGILILGEKKTKKEMAFVIIGVILVVIGGVLIGVTKGI
ncbi:GRP family sugar transporter [Listeria fleischmannii]|uniref:Glucose transporter GlcU n=1 Tax=Listeria fleischmannii TaxID=1069827 RepID=A0A841YFE6_9LIST|nr:GRP family sugar transporter [Listeria fleischmannii]EIA19344.1 glucose uptake protein [Listeria fleischmannii subsp. coloradonensis]MBC1398999.1 glucose transporter GlcU [Listeria fleischmannii]MBC1427252.1 glucose transporter GlcU [Listeria fleischmannii]STY34664.1 Putative glucose uptake permease [Listeria fleischmannii subsp. coloradonensis]